MVEIIAHHHPLLPLVERRQLPPVSLLSVSAQFILTVRAALDALPPELLHLVVEQLWEGESPQKYTLCAFALTSLKCWVIVRPLLFRHIIIRSSDHIRTLAEQVRDTPKIALWINELQFEGESIPPAPTVWLTDPEDVERDRDTWIYSFFSDIGSELPNVRILKLFGFQHLSQRREDLEAFARWIPHLTSLRSVRELRVARCEMSPNALTAIVRAFPDLLHVFLTSVCVGSPNRASLAEVKARPSIIPSMSLDSYNIHVKPNPLKEKIVMFKLKIIPWSIPYITHPRGFSHSL